MITLKRLVFVTLLSATIAGASAAPKSTSGKRINALDSCLWEGSEWIAVVDAPVVTGKIPGNARSADGASWFLADVKNRKKVASAKWMTSGLGVFQLFVNGKPIGEEILKPGFTHYAKTKLSFTYDVTDAISRKAGAENAFSVQVTPGWWADKIITTDWHEGMIGKKPAFRGVLELTYTDGSKEYVKTNTKDWKAAIAGPVKHASIFDGEEYDAREPQGFKKATGWAAPERFDEFKGGIFPSEGAEVYRREDLALAPVEAYVWEGVSGNNDDAYGKINVKRRYDGKGDMVLRPGETLVVDFGQNCAGVPRFTFSAKEGTQLKCCPGELLNDGNGAKNRGMDGPEGSVHRLNLRVPDSGMQMIYTFGDDKNPVTYNPQCTFYGYRFISVTADDEVTIKSVESVPVSSVSKELERGTLTTGDPLVNQLISNTLWGLRSNYLSVPTDCPQRNERLGWTADTQVFAETGTYFADTQRFFHKWMRDMRDTQKETGGYPGVAPIAQYGAYPTDMTRLGWADAGIIVPWVVWKQYNDTNIVNENWESMEKFMNLIGSTKYDHHSLTADNNDYQWADWLSYEPLESCSGRKDYRDENGNVRVRPETYDYWNFLSACYWLSDAEMMRDMAKATGRDAAKYAAMADEARAYIREKFFDENGLFKTGILNTMQTPALFALKNKILEGKAKEDMIKRLRENFAEHGNCLQTGFLGTSILMPTLTENGMSDIAYELLFQRKNPSWLYSVDNGATTIWERWNSYMLDSGMGPQGMNSFNHYAYGCVCEWMWETLAGISTDVNNPGFKRIIMKPVPDKRLGFVKGEYDSPAGKIKSHWRYDGDTWIWEFTVPEGSVAEVTLPGETTAKEYSAGSHKIIR
ncbi:MAG: glycoside hydrolase family 78 protein [Muribaculaceae bacterium]|nr:glycoside hydrolase family 78 protein [Muribaculaceae bacterium]